jgi:hypothetical protein
MNVEPGCLHQIFNPGRMHFNLSTNTLPRTIEALEKINEDFPNYNCNSLNSEIEKFCYENNRNLKGERLSQSKPFLYDSWKIYSRKGQKTKRLGFPETCPLPFQDLMKETPNIERCTTSHVPVECPSHGSQAFPSLNQDLFKLFRNFKKHIEFKGIIFFFVILSYERLIKNPT